MATLEFQATGIGAIWYCDYQSPKLKNNQMYNRLLPPLEQDVEFITSHLQPAKRKRTPNNTSSTNMSEAQGGQTKIRPLSREGHRDELTSMLQSLSILTSKSFSYIIHISYGIIYNIYYQNDNYQLVHTTYTCRPLVLPTGYTVPTGKKTSFKEKIFPTREFSYL